MTLRVYSGFAFGIGLERTAMLKYGINNIKMLFGSDLRVLKQINEKIRKDGNEYVSTIKLA